MPAFSSIGMITPWPAGWRKRWASSKAVPGGCRIRSSARIGWLPRSPTTARSGSSGSPRRPRVTRNRPCCRAPLLPLLTRDVRAEGLICQHCNEILVPFDELPAELRELAVSAWAQQYEPIHAVAHWDDRQRRRVSNYDEAFENAAKQAEQLLGVAGREVGAQAVEFLCLSDLGRPG